MIGVFDSGYGGLTIFRELTKELPEYSFIYSGDNANAPYGAKSVEEIIELTKKGVDDLFRRGCILVVLGCNTASAVALRRLQQEWLLQAWPDRKLLGIVVPTIEQITSGGGQVRVGILGTPRTVESHAYEHEIQKRNPNIQVTQVACANLAGMIESLPKENTEIVHEVQKCVRELCSEKTIDAVLLACTHYELISDVISEALPSGTKLYHQPSIVAKSLQDYLHRHPEIDSQLEKAGKRTYLTSGNPEEVSKKSTQILGEVTEFKSLI